MEERKEYHDVYGWMPRQIVNHLTENDRQLLLLACILQKPTKVGWFITRNVVTALGDKFLMYMAAGVVESLMMDGEEVTKDAVLEGMADVLEGFASDVNTLYQYVSDYLEETGEELPVEEKKTTPHPVDLSNIPVMKFKRDPKTGRFIKTN